MTTLEHYSNDQPDFIANTEKIIKDQIEKWRPQDLYITRIDNWFGEKWLNFAGTIMHELSIWRHPDVKMPPFYPKRVESTKYFSRQMEEYIEKKAPKSLHIYQEGSANHRRNITDFSKDGLFIWYSGNSNLNQKGSVMIYYVKDKDCFTAYAMLSEALYWNILTSKGDFAMLIEESLDASFVPRV